MTVRVTKETQPRVVLKGANSGSVNSGVLSGSGDGVRVSMTFTATAEPLIIIPYGNVAEAQLEAGSFATSYIPTSGSQQTRSADVASIPVTAFGYNQDAGTVVVEFDTVGGADIGDQHYVLSGGGTNTRWAYHSSADALKIYDGTTAPYIMVNQDDLPVKHKIAVACDASSVSTASDGSLYATNHPASGNLPALTTAFVLGSSHQDADQLNGHIKSLSYFPRRLTNAQLQELTS